VVLETPARDELFAVQTPQVFDRDLLLGALSHAVEKKIPVTDDCSAVEAIGMSVHLTEGDYNNIKITTPDDFILAQAILDRENKREEELSVYISRLKPKYSVIIHLFYYEGYSVKEISEICKISSTAVRTRLNRARNQLKSMLLKEGFNETGIQ